MSLTHNLLLGRVIDVYLHFVRSISGYVDLKSVTLGGLTSPRPMDEVRSGHGESFVYG
jgi:hypothetical protein